MLTIPKLVTRPEQTYARITYDVPMQDMQKPAQEGFPALFDWLGQHGVSPIGAPFYNYRRIDMASTLTVEAGVPIDRSLAGSANVTISQLPAGQYVEVTYTGHFDGLYDATAMLIGWAKERGIAWDMTAAPDGDHFACRLEIYETDPDAEPDPNKWVTRLLFKTDGQAT